MRERPRTAELGAVTVPPSFHQLGVLVLDGSGSMGEQATGNVTKAQAVNIAVREMLTRFKVSRYAPNFSFAVVTFDEESRLQTAVTPVLKIDDNADYDPIRGHGGGTKIAAGLSEAYRVTQAFLQEEHALPATAVIVVMSDGRDGEGGIADPQETRRLAEQIHSNPDITICTTYFAQVGATDPDAQTHLRSLARNPEKGFKTVYDAETLRQFLIASTSAATNVNIQ